MLMHRQASIGRSMTYIDRCFCSLRRVCPRHFHFSVGESGGNTVKTPFACASGPTFDPYRSPGNWTETSTSTPHSEFLLYTGGLSSLLGSSPCDQWFDWIKLVFFSSFILCAAPSSLTSGPTVDRARPYSATSVRRARPKGTQPQLRRLGSPAAIQVSHPELDGGPYRRPTLWGNRLVHSTIFRIRHQGCWYMGLRLALADFHGVLAEDQRKHKRERFAKLHHLLGLRVPIPSNRRCSSPPRVGASMARARR
jgi:hypothetical protein